MNEAEIKQLWFEAAQRFGMYMNNTMGPLIDHNVFFDHTCTLENYKMCVGSLTEESQSPKLSGLGSNPS